MSPFKKQLVICAMLALLVLPGLAYARITPEDILNSQKDSYNLKVKNYSPANKQKLEELNKQIAALNKQKTTELEQNILRQSEILEEYIRRNNLKEKTKTDGINRNLADPVENARYWVTYAHEAVAYQAAKVYVFNLSSEANIKNDELNTISGFESDLNILRNKVIKSQKIISNLVK